MPEHAHPPPDSEPPPQPANGLRKNISNPIVGASALVPALFADAGERAAFGALEFFAAQLRNPNTRAA